MTRRDKCLQLRTLNQSVAVGLDDATAAQVPSVYDAWDGNGMDYPVGERVNRYDVVYKCTIAHTSQMDWAPEVAVSLWEKI